MGWGLRSFRGRRHVAGVYGFPTRYCAATILSYAIPTRCPYMNACQHASRHNNMVGEIMPEFLHPPSSTSGTQTNTHDPFMHFQSLCLFRVQHHHRTTEHVLRHEDLDGALCGAQKRLLMPDGSFCLLPARRAAKRQNAEREAGSARVTATLRARI